MYIGCGTGLSMYMLDSKWPSIEKVTGIILYIFVDGSDDYEVLINNK
jgi:trans-aconitate methyltransferase